MKSAIAVFVSLLLVGSVEAATGAQIKFTKISGTFIKFDDGHHFETAVSYASQELRIDQHEIIVKTFGQGKPVETRFTLQGPAFLDFIANSDNPKIPPMTGHFFDSNYEECTMTTVLSEQKINVNGVLTKLDQSHALSTKTLVDIATSKVVGIVQERVELISQDSFNAATQRE